MNTERDILVSKNNLSIVKNNKKCIKCGYCVDVCKNDMDVLSRCIKFEDIKKLCINCGQCTLTCPVDAIREKYNYSKVLELLKDKKKIMVVSLAPAVRTAFLEEFGIINNKNCEGKIIGVLKELGFDYVFDIASGADLVIVEEAKELEQRLKNKENLPMLSSCCPAFVKYILEFYPELIPNLSTCKSPIAMFGTIIKTYFKEIIKVKAKDIVNVVITPCPAKKEEIKRSDINIVGEFLEETGLKDTDYILTTRELAILVKKNHIDLKKVKVSSFDNPILSGTRAGLLFGSSGGVAESLIRTVYYDINHKNLEDTRIVIDELRGSANIKEFKGFLDLNLKVMSVSGLKNAKDVLEKIRNKEIEADFIEIMACPSGCINGGGQPKTTLLSKNKILKNRKAIIQNADLESKQRLCHESPFIKKVYKNFLGEPGGVKANTLLHRTYQTELKIKEKQ